MYLVHLGGCIWRVWRLGTGVGSVKHAVCGTRHTNGLCPPTRWAPRGFGPLLRMGSDPGAASHLRCCK